MTNNQRLKLNWYDKRLNQNKKIKNFLTDKVLEHEPDIGYSKNKLMYLNYEDLLELAIACVNKKLSITLGEGKDYCDLSDSKAVISQFRNNNKAKAQWTNSMAVTGVSCKEGGLRVLGYNVLADNFHFFYIPFNAFQHISSVIEIIIERGTYWGGEPEFTGTPDRSRSWWNYEVDTFEDMCLASPIQSVSKKKVNNFENLFDLSA
jgi:hypothetical protein